MRALVARSWRRPPIENGAIVETNTRARWANWKQFYTNGAQSMLNQMGDGGPFVVKEWDEAVASMAMCEEATFVFSVGATQRAMMPFVACRKAPPGTVIVAEVGLINVKRDGGRRQEVNDFLTAKFVAERKQQKLDRLDEQKFLRLRMKQDRKDKADSVMKLLKANLDSQVDSMAEQKDSTADDVLVEGGAAFGAAGGADGGAAGGAAGLCQPCAPEAASSASTAPPSPARATGSTPSKVVDDEAEAWEEEPALDYEGFGEADDFFAQAGDLDLEPLNLPSAFDDDDDLAAAAAGTAAAASAALPSAFDDETPHFKAVEEVEKRTKAQSPFIAAETFDGAKPGYVFKNGSSGVGYYVDLAAGRAPWETETLAPVPSGRAGSAAVGAAPWDVSDGAATSTSKASLSAPPKKANDPWAMIDSVTTDDTRARDQAAADRFASEAASSAALAAKKAAAQKQAQQQAAAKQQAVAKPPPAAGTMKPILEGLGLGPSYAAFEAAGLADATKLAAMHRDNAADVSVRLTKLGLKMGQRQKVVLALANK